MKDNSNSAGFFHTSYYRYIKNPIIIGTILLTLSGFITKIIGFFYRIFLSHIIKEEGLGIIGLVSPVLVLAHCICSSGIQNAITRYVAASKKGNSSNSFSYLFTGIFISCTLSFCMAYLIFNNASFISRFIIKEPRCTPLLQISALSFPLASLHCCINGFFYGCKQTGIPAISMIIEQITRVLTVYALYIFTLNSGANFSLSFVCIGMLLGEFASAFFSSAFLIFKSKKVTLLHKKLLSLTKGVSLFSMALPISLNRICISLISAAETIQLPLKLTASGLSSSEALSIYGVFSGMALPLILFPSAITGAASSLLLPSISEAQANKNNLRIKKIFKLTLLICLLLGIICMLFFLCFADFFGIILFKNNSVAGHIRALSFVCPFLYLSGTLTSILNGLGKTNITFIFNLISILLRLCFVLFLVPNIGFSGYVYGIISSQIIYDLLIILALRHFIIYN